jgi:uncharacterized protein GlcG (DUF336 family)
MNVSLVQADLIITGAIAEARARKAKSLAVIVLDAGGHPVAFRREDKSSLYRHDIAKAKAMGALGMGVDTRVMAERAAKNPTFFASITSIPGVDLPYSPGGNLIKDASGEIIGAIGISGDTGEVDEACAIAGIVSANLHCGE